MQLSNEERRQISRILRTRFEIEQLERLVGLADQDFEEVVKKPFEKLSAIKDILDRAQNEGWTMDLLRAITEDVQERLASPAKEDVTDEINKVQASLKQRWGRGTAVADPFLSCIVRAGWPFINRPQISRAFTELDKPAGFRIAVVNGPPGSGKTYSKLLPQFVAEIRGNQSFKVFYRDLSESEYSIKAENLVRSILSEWKQNAPLPINLSTGDNYATELAEWVTAQIPPGETWWIIIDGLAKLKSPDKTLVEFLMGLAKFIADSPHPLRLVLLDLGDQHAYPPGAGLMTLKASLDALTARDLVDHYFKALHLAMAAAAPFDEETMMTQAQELLKRVAPQTATATPRLTLHELLLQTTNELGLGS